ncbi:MAG: HTH domain-containing protein [Anaerolinea sp.]|nr:HTH domain-containing protein [Anaerolinea sp.]
MPKINYNMVEQTKNKILQMVSTANGISENDLCEQSGIERRTVNNYLRLLQQEGRVIKAKRLWYIAMDNNPVSKVSRATLSALESVDSMLADGIELDKALDYLKLDQATYRAAICYRKIVDSMYVLSTRQKSFVVCFKMFDIAIIVQAESGISRTNLVVRIARELLPNALQYGPNKAILVWLRAKTDRYLVDQET